MVRHMFIGVLDFIEGFCDQSVGLSVCQYQYPKKWSSLMCSLLHGSHMDWKTWKSEKIFQSGNFEQNGKVFFYLFFAF